MLEYRVQLFARATLFAGGREAAEMKQYLAYDIYLTQKRKQPGPDQEYGADNTAIAKEG
jgi:hypothetical protein